MLFNSHFVDSASLQKLFNSHWEWTERDPFPLTNRTQNNGSSAQSCRADFKKKEGPSLNSFCLWCVLFCVYFFAWPSQHQVLEEGAAVANKSGLPLDPACFVPALRACCTGGGGGGRDSNIDVGADDDGRERAAGFKAAGAAAAAGAALLEEMEARAGVAPDSWCANVVMEVGRVGTVCSGSDSTSC